MRDWCNWEWHVSPPYSESTARRCEMKWREEKRRGVVWLLFYLPGWDLSLLKPKLCGIWWEGGSRRTKPRVMRSDKAMRQATKNPIDPTMFKPDFFSDPPPPPPRDKLLFCGSVRVDWGDCLLIIFPSIRTTSPGHHCFSLQFFSFFILLALLQRWGVVDDDWGRGRGSIALQRSWTQTFFCEM